MRPIDGDVLYEKVMELEELARRRVLDTDPSLPYATNLNPSFARYVAQLDERIGLKRLVANAPTIELMRWIPCSERMPPTRQSVILCTKEWTGEGCYWETTEHHVIWKGYRWNTTYWDDEVLAWMPLPKPYKGEKHEIN